MIITILVTTIVMPAPVYFYILHILNKLTYKLYSAHQENQDMVQLKEHS